MSTALDKAREARGKPAVAPNEAAKAYAVDRIPEHYLKTYYRAQSGKSRAMAIKSFCLECQGHERAAVRDCDVQGCPLWPYRPYQP